MCVINLRNVASFQLRSTHDYSFVSWLPDLQLFTISHSVSHRYASIFVAEPVH